MGIQNFTKVFAPKKEIKYKELTGKHIAIDASVEVYRAALGMSVSNGLTDANGNPTSHINTILLGVILKLKSFGVNQYWVFDYSDAENTTYHNPLKKMELEKRIAQKKRAKDRLDQLKSELDQIEIFSSDEDEDETITDKKNKQDIINKKKKIETQEKAAFTMQKFYMDDVIFMLDCLEVPWIQSPPGFDAEQLCAISTNDDRIFGTKMDYVLTPDVDALLFGANKIIKRDTRKKKLYEYDLRELLSVNDISLNDLIKIGLILGSDFADKTPGIGPKTVMKKYQTIVLSEAQTKAMNEKFTRTITNNEVKSIQVNNNTHTSFTNKIKYDLMLDWLVYEKSYNRDRIDKQFKKAKLFI